MMTSTNFALRLVYIDSEDTVCEDFGFFERQTRMDSSHTGCICGSSRSGIS
jgi:hypothetical protein